MSGWLVKNELERISKEAKVISKALSRSLLGKSEGSYRKPLSL
jgi:hypothetical protein